MADWARDAVFYHIYPLGLCGAPQRNDFHTPPVARLAQIAGWAGHMAALGVNALYLGPLFESSCHGYDTADYYRVDRRLGDNTTLTELVATLHSHGIRVILDGVFHHVGRDFWAFRDLRERGQASPYSDWFVGIDWRRTSPYGDPFAYAGWNGHYDLVKLNLAHPAVRAHLFGAVAEWVRQFAIDGLRLDVASEIDPAFLRDLAAHCRSLNPNFWLLGEAIHGDYRALANPATLDSATNYECYKGLYSSLNDRNYFEIAYALNRQYGPQGLYVELPLYNFADNHDVDRVASVLDNPAHLYPLYALLFTMPGVPSIYYGSEWGLGGRRTPGDDWPLRPGLQLAEAAAYAPHPSLAVAITRFAQLRAQLPALRHGSYRQLFVNHLQLAFARSTLTDYTVVALNAAESPARLDLPVEAPEGCVFSDLLDPQFRVTVRAGRLAVETVPPCWVRVLAPEARG